MFPLSLIFSAILLYVCRPHLLADDCKITEAAEGEKISSRADLKTLNVSNLITKPVFSVFSKLSCKSFFTLS